MSPKELHRDEGRGARVHLVAQFCLNCTCGTSRGGRRSLSLQGLEMMALWICTRRSYPLPGQTTAEIKVVSSTSNMQINQWRELSRHHGVRSCISENPPSQPVLAMSRRPAKMYELGFGMSPPSSCPSPDSGVSVSARGLPRRTREQRAIEFRSKVFIPGGVNDWH